MMEYQVGDTVIHASYGMGEIVKLDEKFIHERQMLCYVVRIGDMSIWVMADQTGNSGLRSPTPESDFKKLFKILSSPGEPLPSHWSDRKIYLSERLKDGKLTSTCTVIRDLAYLRKNKRLNDYDKATLERAKDLLLAEWMYTLSVSRLEADSELMRLLGGT